MHFFFLLYVFRWSNSTKESMNSFEECQTYHLDFLKCLTGLVVSLEEIKEKFSHLSVRKGFFCKKLSCFFKAGYVGLTLRI